MLSRTEKILLISTITFTLVDSLVGYSWIERLATYLGENIAVSLYAIVLSMAALVAVAAFLYLRYRKNNKEFVRFNSTPRISVQEFEEEQKTLTDLKLKELYSSEAYQRYMQNKEQNDPQSTNQQQTAQGTSDRNSSLNFSGDQKARFRGFSASNGRKGF